MCEMSIYTYILNLRFPSHSLKISPGAVLEILNFAAPLLDLGFLFLSFWLSCKDKFSKH